MIIVMIITLIIIIVVIVIVIVIIKKNNKLTTFDSNGLNKKWRVEGLGELPPDVYQIFPQIFHVYNIFWTHKFQKPGCIKYFMCIKYSRHQGQLPYCLGTNSTRGA